VLDLGVERRLGQVVVRLSGEGRSPLVRMQWGSSSKEYMEVMWEEHHLTSTKEYQGTRREEKGTGTS